MARVALPAVAGVVLVAGGVVLDEEQAATSKVAPRNKRERVMGASA